MLAELKPGSAGRVIVAVAAFVVIIAGMRAAEVIVVPFLVSLLVAIICSPPIAWLKRKGVPGGLAMLAVIVGLMGIGFGVAAVVATSVDSFTAKLPSYQARLQQEMAASLTWLDAHGVQISYQAFRDIIDPGAAMGLVATVLAGLGSVVANGFLILLTVFFILLETSSFPAKLRAAMSYHHLPLRPFTRFTDSVKDYLVIKTAINLATGVVVGLWVWSVGVDFPVLWGLLAFVLNYVPSIGSIIAAIPPVLLALIQFDVERSLLLAMGYLVVNVLVGQVLEPRIMGRGMGLSPLIVFLSLVFWGWMLGGAGMLLSIPLTMTVKIALESSEETRWIAILLDSKAPPEEPPPATPEASAQAPKPAARPSEASAPAETRETPN